jgi:hypothetical protein
MFQNLDLRFLLFYCLFVKKKKFHPLLLFFGLVFYYLFLFFDLVFYCPSFSPFFFVLVLSLFLAHVVLSLVYPNLFRTKMLGCCCCFICCSRILRSDILKSAVRTSSVLFQHGTSCCSFVINLRVRRQNGSLNSTRVMTFYACYY